MTKIVFFHSLSITLKAACLAYSARCWDNLFFKSTFSSLYVFNRFIFKRENILKYFPRYLFPNGPHTFFFTFVTLLWLKPRFITPAKEMWRMPRVEICNPRCPLEPTTWEALKKCSCLGSNPD